MGKVKLGAPLSKNSINHFSHPHPLEFTTQPIIPSSSSSLSCSACKLQVLSGSSFYTCKTCNFSLHADCFKLHPEITHPFHSHHVLTLLPKTPYPFGLFSCDACGEQGDGFSYHCHSCGLDLHVQCAVLPLSVTHHSHHHPLQIIFPSPHSQTQVFSCDICKSLGQGNLWKYRCHCCDFDAHLNCTKRISGQTVNASASRISPLQPNLGFRPPQVPQINRPPLQNLMTPNVNPMNLQGINNGVGNRQNFDELMRAYIENYSRLYGGGGAGTATQGGGGSGGGGGGLDFLQALNGGGGLNGNDDDYLRLLNGGGSGGGGGGGRLDFLQGLNGGGGLDHYLQLLNAGGSVGGLGGAGGLEYLQAFTSGGGGGGGAALLQALMGGGGGVNGLSNILGGDGGASVINTLAGLFGGLNF